MARRRRDQAWEHDRKAGELRCAVYTRKSTEEGLDQEFNSLHAQREACEAFVRSQRSEGWVLVRKAYDDGGLSGGTLERPALQRLLADIRDGHVDNVVVYKVDRLTRSLADFAKLVETFDAAGASFVSVTQAFNTSTSMGRLTLNMLLSFAQFEREVTAERIRDKIAASKRKGMWMGGLVPLGYDAVDRKLVVNEAEARTVRHVYARYLALGSIRHLKAELDRDGIVSKTRVSGAGKQIGGTILSRGALVLILKNPLYIGEVHHRGERFPGQHEAIIERETWNAVQESLELRRVERRAGTNARDLSPLAGMLFDDQGRPLSPSHASKGPARVRYRYYISHGLSAGLAENHRDGWRLPAEPVERTVRNALSSFLQKQTAVHEILEPSGSAAEHQQCLTGVEALRRDVETSHAATLRHLLTTLAARIEIGADSVAISVSRTALQRQIGVVVGASSTDEPLVFRQPLALRKRGVETKLVLGDSISPERDQALVKLIADARSWAKRLVDGEFSSVRALARELRLEHRHVARALPLAYLAPDIVEEILDGRQPVTLTVTGLKRLPALPLRWDKQPETLGFPRKA